ncbi:tol-pal system protein YbgF [uncultured Massilia sp.]|uniref:tol-pal system protein YbgF n=1 Tax=uncultured Massilia sp. TaxID=169973 RepID=UPI0025E33592|nr:tol-pal system protein YbgF [uncultured Massilia sp.]
MIKLPQLRLAAAALALAAWFPLHANAGLLDDDEARRAILDLRAKVEALARDVNARIDTKADKSATLDMLNQHEQTMQEIARLRGQIEVLANQIAVSQKNQKDLYADLDARMRKLEPRQEVIDGQAAQVLPSEKSAYDAAMELFKGGDYKGAASALQGFVRQYPESAYAANAQYWLGNAYYAQRDYKNAIAAQEAVVANYGTSAKAPDAMLNIASSYTEMKDAKNAKKTLQALLKKFPDSAAGQTAKDRLAALK